MLSCSIAADGLNITKLDLTPSEERRRLYVQYLGVIAVEELHLREARFGRLSRGWAIGTKAFKQDLKKDFLERGADLERFALLADKRAQREMREEGREQILSHAPVESTPRRKPGRLTDEFRIYIKGSSTSKWRPYR